jgi:ATP-binding cassette subfamily B protein/subfamily B ATP-binding cassette protein MsbA
MSPGPAAAGFGEFLRVVRYARPGWRAWLLIAALMLVNSALALMQPWPMKIVLDHVLGQMPMPRALEAAVQVFRGSESAGGLLAWTVFASLAIFGLASASDIVVTRTWVRVGHRMVYRLAEDLFARLQRRSVLFHSRNRVGDSLSRITGDSWCVYKVVDSLLFTPGYALVMIVGIVALMARLDWGLALIAVAAAPLMAVVSFVLGRRIRRAARARRESESLIQLQVQRALSGIQVVQAFAQEDQEAQRFERCTRSALESQQRVTMVTAVYNLASGLIMTLGSGAVLWFGARHVIGGSLTLGGLLLFVAYLNMLQAQLKSLLGVYGTLQEVGAGVDRVCDILDADCEVRDAPGAVSLPASRGHVVLEHGAGGVRL